MHRTPPGTAFRSARAVAAVALLIALATAALATTLRRLTLEEVAGHAREIVAGTVRETRSVAGDEGRGMIWTDVVLDDLDVWSGSVPGATVTYRFAGGEIGGRRLRAAGMPVFEKGARYVLFANPDADELCPTVGWHQGRYRIVRDGRTGTDHVEDSDGHPVYGFESGLPVTERSQERPRALSVVELQVEVTRVLEAVARRREREAQEAAEKAAGDETPEGADPAPKDAEDAR